MKNVNMNKIILTEIKSYFNVSVIATSSRMKSVQTVDNINNNNKENKELNMSSFLVTAL